MDNMTIPYGQYDYRVNIYSIKKPSKIKALKGYTRIIEIHFYDLNRKIIGFYFSPFYCVSVVCMLQMDIR